MRRTGRTETRWGVIAAVLAAGATTTQAGMILQSGPPTCTHVGNLVTNGSFEIGSPGPGAANYRFWAAGTTFTPFAVPPGWSSSGQPGTYAIWGADLPSPPYRLRNSDVLSDGQVGMYFGNGAGVTVNQAPTFNPDRTVTFASTPTFTVPMGGDTRLWQTVPTNTNIAPSYCFGFWVAGEDSNSPGGPLNDGIFGLRVTNVLPGDPVQYFQVPSGWNSPMGASTWYEFSLTPLNPLVPITIEFINWGHLDLTQYGRGGTTELVLDDVIINPVPEPASIGLLAIGSVMALRRRRRATPAS